MNATTCFDTELNIVVFAGVVQEVKESKNYNQIVDTMANKRCQLVANALIFGMNVNGNVNKWNKTAAITRFPRDKDRIIHWFQLALFGC